MTRRATPSSSRSQRERVELSGATGGRVGLLGTGLMGTAMAHRLLSQGMAVIAWDRAPEHVEPLAARGAEVAGTAAEVVNGAQAVITMLPTADIVLDVVEPLLEGWPEGTIWLQMSSVGATEADGLVRTAAAHDVPLVDAPVSGSTHPAEEGHLTILARERGREQLWRRAPAARRRARADGRRRERARRRRTRRGVRAEASPRAER